MFVTIVENNLEQFTLSLILQMFSNSLLLSSKDNYEHVLSVLELIMLRNSSNEKPRNFMHNMTLSMNPPIETQP